MQTLAQLKDLWRSRENAMQAKIDQLRAQGMTETSDFETALKAEFGEQYPNHWPDVICQPIAEQIKAAGGFAEVKVLGPMGIGARVSFHCYRNAGDEIEKISSLTVEPNLEDDAASALSMIDYNVNTGRYEKGSLGYQNGLNYGTVDIDPNTNGDQWLALLNGPEKAE